MRIRPEQVAAFRPHAETAFESALVEYLRAEHGDYPVRVLAGETTVGELPDEELLGMVRGGIARARGYGMTWESSLASFVILMFVVAPGFDSHPLVRHALTDRGVEPDLRIDQLLAQTTGDNWDAVEEQYRAEDWLPRGADKGVKDARRAEQDAVEG